jgi:outer membrane murein-binding lipoprotein Lpp
VAGGQRCRTMKSRPWLVSTCLSLFCLLGGIAAGCHKTISEEENTALVNRCLKVAEAFRDELADFTKFLETHRDQLGQFPQLRARVKAAREKAGQAGKELDAAMKNIPAASLMTRSQADALAQALDRITKARQALQDARANARRRLGEKGKRPR